MKRRTGVWRYRWSGNWHWHVRIDREADDTVVQAEGTVRTRAEGRRARDEAMPRVAEAWRILTGEEL